MVVITRATLYDHTDVPEVAPGEIVLWAPGGISPLGFDHATVDTGVTEGMVTLATGRRDRRCGCGIEVDLSPDAAAALAEELLAAAARTTVAAGRFGNTGEGPGQPGNHPTFPEVALGGASPVDQHAHRQGRGRKRHATAQEAEE